MRIVGAITLMLLCAFSAALLLVHVSKEQNYEDIVLPSLLEDGTEFSTANIRKNNRAYVINVFASWCTTCIAEHEIWNEIVRKDRVDIYGINYLDIKPKAIEWLATHGNPYKMVAMDYSGVIFKKLGVAGVPETLVFDKNGKMIMRISGSITMDLWEKRISKLVT